MKYTIKRTRRKTIQIKMLSHNECEISCPLYCSRETLNDFISKAQSWIHKTSNKLLVQENKYSEIINRSKALIFGREYTVYYNQEKNYIDNDNMQLILKDDSLKSFLSKMAKSVLNKRILLLSKQMNVQFNSIRISSAKKRWGSCSARKNINLNWRIICLPEHLQDYILIHELSHIKELNHSMDFWNYVGKFCPNFKECRKELGDKFSFILKLE